MKTRLINLNLCLLGVLVAINSSPTLAEDKDEKKEGLNVVRLENSRTGELVELKQLVDSISRTDVVFLGEKHDNDSGHAFQLEVIKELVKRELPIAISTEQFERDVQGALNDYLSGRIGEADFLEASRPWKNYSQHYRPIVEFAKAQNIPVIAANIPRRIASVVAQGKQPSSEDRIFMPRQTNATKNAYWEKFKSTMAGHVGSDGEEKLDAFFASQCLKDDTMAESITDFIAANSHNPKILVHLCGHFHSDYGLGTVSRVLQRRPLTHCIVVTMESNEKTDDKPKPASLRTRSHYTFWTVNNVGSD